MKLQVSFTFLVSTNRVLHYRWRSYYFSLFLLLGFTTATSAQDKVWDKTIGGSSGDALITAKQTPDGGYILAGNSSSSISGDKSQNNQGKKDKYGNLTTDYWVVKLNADGSKAWDKTFGGSDYDDLKSLVLTPDGGFLLGGTSLSAVSGNKTSPDRGAADYWIVKLDAAGTKIWEKNYGGSSYDYLVSIQEAPDGNYLLGGNSVSGIVGDRTAPRSDGNFWVVKIKPDGTKIWDKAYGGRNSSNLTAFASTPDGGLLLAGEIYEQGRKLIKIKPDHTVGWEKDWVEAVKIKTTQNGEILVAYGSGDYGLTKLKADGSEIWALRFGADQLEVLTDFEQTSDGGYLLGGYSNSGISGDKTEGYQGACTVDDISCDTDYWVVKVKADGTKEWDRALGSAGSDGLTSVQQTTDGGYLLGGNSSSDITKDKTQNSKGSSDFWVIKLDNTVRKNQTITFGNSNLLTRTLGDAPFVLEATSSSGLPVSFRVVSGPATVQGNELTVSGANTVHIQAYQPGNAQFNATVTDLFIPVEARPTIVKQWDRTLGGFNREALLALIPTPDGGYLAGGYSESGKTGDKSSATQGASDYWITKLNNQGAKLWDKAYGGNQADSLTILLATPDGGYLLGGTSYSGNSGDKSQGSKGSGDYWILKIDAAGNKLWDKTYGGNQADKLTALISTPDGGFLLGGTSFSGTGGDKSQGSKGRSDYWILKIDANGAKLWDKTYGGAEADRLVALALVPGGGYLIGGTSASSKSGDKSEARRGQADYWVLRLQENGNKQWDKTLGGLTETYAYDECFEDDPAKCQVDLGSSVLTSLLVTPDGNFLIGGYSDAEQGGDKTDKNIGGNSYTRLSDYWIVKLNSKGIKVWDKTYGGIRSEKVFDIGTYLTGNSELAAIRATPDGNYLLAGTSDSDKGGDKSENASGGGERFLYYYSDQFWSGRRSERDYWILKIDEAGTRLWDRTLGSRDDDVLGAVIPTANSGYLLGGTSNGLIGDDKTEAPRDTVTYPFASRGDFWLVQVLDETPPPSANWNMRYGGTGTDNFADVIKTTDGGYLSGGYTDSNISGDKTQWSQGRNDYWIVKSDKNGLKQWEKSYGGANNDYLNRVIQTQDGGYLLAGSSFSGKKGDKTEVSQGGRDYWLVKTDKLGNKLWDKTLGGSGNDELEKVIQLSSGEYVLGGYSNSPVSGDKTQASQGNYDYWLVKISSTGTKIWDKRYGGTGADRLGGFTQTRDGGFFLGGGSSSGQGGDKTQASRGDVDYWAVKTDKDGNLLWEKTYGGTGQDYAVSVRHSDGDNLYLAGYSTSGASGDKSQASRGGRDYWLIKIDANGTKLWDKGFGGDKDDNLSASTYTEQGHYLLAGTSYSGVSGDKTQASQGSGDYWVVEVDEQGNLVMDQRAGGSGEDELRTVTQTKDGGLLLGGRSNSGASGDRTQPSQGGTDYWLIKVVPTNNARVAARTATTPEESAELTPLLAYPNPFQEQVTVRFTLPQTQAASVRVLDGQGREIATLFRGEAKAKQTYQVQWQAGKQAAGMYLLQLQTPTKQNTQKLLLNK
ncbi:T9SS type A sorting domain-containing protein [Adhaeribacter pallidiroseus]|uniref:Secretion system C-terminal sorting domain-containing protein n=1 Tax=Adhaeribacter pallidiroseus TaxID=2072847 RepID=A0A369QPA1_9BACT|nr:T9SS type A sorting domain-containing protein [Adhaeribacter pallidiroseus]RDC66162.1 hypothetical protein AHMF7616_04793 [Adhaeribacter pallidiroseus]